MMVTAPAPAAAAASASPIVTVVLDTPPFRRATVTMSPVMRPAYAVNGQMYISPSVQLPNTRRALPGRALGLTIAVGHLVAVGDDLLGWHDPLAVKDHSVCVAPRSEEHTS